MPEVVLITGCSTGLGRDLANACLKRGLTVIASARKRSALEELEHKGASVITLDVTVGEEQLEQFAKEVISKFPSGRIDYLINNAGFLQAGAMEELSQQLNLAQFQTNFFGVINLTNAFLPYFRSQHSGCIVNISSVSDTIPTPGAGIYCASKAALSAMTDVLHSELEPLGIACFSVELGSFATNVGTSTNFKKEARYLEQYSSAHSWQKGFTADAGNEPGDTVVASERIIDVMTCSGSARGMKSPRRFALGDDAVQLIEYELHKRLQEVEAFKTLSVGTLREGIDEVALNKKIAFVSGRQ